MTILWRHILFFKQTLALDLLWIIPTFVVSVVAAVRETDGRNLADNSGFNQGSFAAAAVRSHKYTYRHRFLQQRISHVFI